MNQPKQSPSDDLARCLAEQRECAAYLLSDAADKAGARLGLGDWTAEEVILLEFSTANPQ